MRTDGHSLDEKSSGVVGKSPVDVSPHCRHDTFILSKKTCLLIHTTRSSGAFITGFLTPTGVL